MSVLTESERSEFLANHPEWAIENEMLVRTYEFKDFVEAFAFVARVALHAEKIFHHPDIEIKWNTVTLNLTTHSAGGVTSKDVELVEAIEKG
jgi:4a-hydroxytetrahydrobiopterin dehydratase